MNADTVLDIFKEITAIPRESGHEEPVTAWLQNWAASRGLECRTDEVHNVLITRNAAPGKENVPTIVLQAHQDMVCEKNKGCTHDFLKDPIEYVVKDGWMIAENTTLGADDGIGIAACLALLQDSAPTGRIECLFTISEETGMDGAFGMKEGFFTGKTLINLDSEDEGQLFIGCAGGMHTEVSFKVNRTAVKDGNVCVKLTIKDGIGGHSGDDINKGRVNTVQEMARFLYQSLPCGYQLLSIDGGGKSNAIARETEAIVAVPAAASDNFCKAFDDFGFSLKQEFHVTDPDVKCVSETLTCDVCAFDDASAKAVVTSLCSCPHGYYAMSQDIPDLVETSTNLASVHTSADGVDIMTSQRSSIASRLRMIADKVAANFSLAGAEVSHNSAYPGWAPDVKSHILQVCVDSYRRLFNAEPEVKAIHAGLECGLFLEKFPGLDMISFGPTLRGVHAPGERLELASLDKFVKLLDDVVCRFK